MNLRVTRVCMLWLTCTAAGNALATAANPDRVEALASNRIAVSADGITVRNPHHTVVFDVHGPSVRALAGLTWRWQLQHLGPDGGQSQSPARMLPRHDGDVLIDYGRGDVIERYVLKPRSLEQQFILLRRPGGGAADFLIEGRVVSSGRLETHPDAWIWRGPRGAIRLGQVHVFDAAGTRLPARLTVDANKTSIRVDGSALVHAAYPVTVDPEIGTDDFQISHPGSPAQYDSGEAAVAYNARDNEYAVVWWGDNPLSGNNEFVIFAQLFDASDGSETSAEIIVGDNGLTGQSAPRFPDVAWNSNSNEYLVVWRADRNSSGNPKEIYGQRLAANGTEVGVDDFRISDIAVAGSDRDAGFPAVAHNPSTNEYLVVWEGDGLADDGDREIFGQFVSAAGAEIGPDDFRISDQGSEGASDEKAGNPDVTYNDFTNQFLVVWEGDTAAGVDLAPEVFGQLMDAAGDVVRDDFPISQSGGAAFAARAPGVAANSIDGEYLVVWWGDHATLGADDEFAIRGRRLDGGGDGLGIDFSVGNTVLPLLDPPPRAAAVHNVVNNEYFVAWPGSVSGERLAADGTVVENDFALSTHTVVAASGESHPLVAAAHAVLQNEYLTLWVADSNSDGQNLVYGQRYAGAPALRFAATAISADEDQGSATITVNRIGLSSEQVSVDFSSSDGTATAPGDYTAVSGTLTFAAGVTSQTFDVALTDDGETENDETVMLTLSNPIDAALIPGNDSAVLTIIDDETGGGGGGSGGGSSLSWYGALAAALLALARCRRRPRVSVRSRRR